MQEEIGRLREERNELLRVIANAETWHPPRAEDLVTPDGYECILCHRVSPDGHNPDCPVMEAERLGL